MLSLRLIKFFCLLISFNLFPSEGTKFHYHGIHVYQGRDFDLNLTLSKDEKSIYMVMDVRNRYTGDRVGTLEETGYLEEDRKCYRGRVKQTAAYNNGEGNVFCYSQSTVKFCFEKSNPNNVTLEYTIVRPTFFPERNICTSVATSDVHYPEVYYQEDHTF